MELPDAMTVEQVDVLTRKLQSKVYHQTGVILAGVGVYSFNTKDDEASKIRNTIQETVMAHDWVLQLHGFYVDTCKKDIRFDVVLNFEIKTSEGISIIQKELKNFYPDYNIYVAPDVDVSD